MDSDATQLDAADALLIEYLKDNDDLCPLCGYNVRYLTLPRCPECGKRLTLQLVTEQPMLRSWLMCLVPLGLAAGLALFYTALTINQGAPPLTARYVLVWISFALAYLACPMLLVLLIMRRQFTKLAANWQRLCIVFSCLQAGIAYASILAYFISFFS